MSNLMWGIILIVGGEGVIHLLFFAISRLLGKDGDKLTVASFIKGLLERLFIVICLLQNFSSALGLLGALKIATRIQGGDKVSNDFFVMGNLVSVLFGIGYYMVVKKLQGA